MYTSPKTIETSQQIYNVKSIPPAEQKFHHLRIHSTGPVTEMGINPKELPESKALGAQLLLI
jgi:hypothetical protein